MKQPVIVLLSLFVALTLSRATAQSCGSISECKGIAVSANEQAKQYAQETAEVRRQERQATADARTATAQAMPTVTPWPTPAPQATVTPMPIPTATQLPTLTPLPSATNRPSALDRLVDRVLAEPTVTTKREGAASTPWTTYLVLALLGLFALGMLKVIFGQTTTILPGRNPPATREDDELDI